MAEFICKIGSESGEIIERRFNAETRELLQLDLEQKGYYIFSIKQAGFSLFGAGGGPKKVKPDDFIVFNQELRALLKAGLPAMRSLDILIKRQKDTALGTMLRAVRESIETGSSLSEAFSVFRDQLPTAYIATLVAGERSGNLAEAIDRFVTYAKLTNTLRKNFKKALYYPVFLISLSFGMIALMLLYVLPEFSKFYEGFEEELPGITIFVMGLAETLRSNWMFILIGLAALWLVHMWWKSTEGGRRMWARILISFPLFGDIAYKYQLSQLFHSLSVMLRGGMPLLSALNDLRKSASNPLFVDGLETAATRVSEGDSLTTAVDGTVLDTDLTTEMIEVGESTGALPDMLSNVAEFYDEEVVNRMEAMLSLLEPVLLMVMALIVGSLLFAMYYPLFNLMGNLGGTAI